MRKVVIFLALGAIGYWAYSAAPQASNLSGQEAFLPQAIGMLLTALIYSIVISFKEKSKMAIFESVSYKHIISGFFFAFAALTYLISAQPDMNGLATGFILSQTSVVLATLTGIWFLNQRKTKRNAPNNYWSGLNHYCSLNNCYYLKRNTALKAVFFILRYAILEVKERSNYARK